MAGRRRAGRGWPRVQSDRVKWCTSGVRAVRMPPRGGIRLSRHATTRRIPDGGLRGRAVPEVRRSGASRAWCRLPGSVSAMSDLQRSPLYDRHVALGAKLADFGGWLMPIEYGASGGGVLREHAAVREAVGVFDVS